MNKDSGSLIPGLLLLLKKGLKPIVFKPLLIKWTLLGSNQRPPDYESGALTI